MEIARDIVSRPCTTAGAGAADAAANAAQSDCRCDDEIGTCDDGGGALALSL